MAAPFWDGLRGWLLGEEEGSMLWALAFTCTVALVPALLVAKGSRAAPTSGRRRLQRPPSGAPDGAAGQARPREPEHLLCPVTQALFRDPVFVVDSGNTYEREALMDYWERVGEARDPLTNLALESREVRTNWAVRREVQAFLGAHPDFTPEGWDTREMLPPDRPRAAPRPPEAPPPPEPNDAEPGLPEAARAHCAALAAASGGALDEATVAHLAQAFGVDAELLRQHFGRRRAEPPEGGGAAEALPATVRVHCAPIAQAHGGFIPEAILRHLATSLGADEAAMRAAYGRPAAE
mmetsp:Transcript_92755/g.276669  ORF Transcript_92755/g.276669 Transcript_92755/m.276669 type:complete len:294 (+) Transcript_92755:27-908(+)